MRFFVLSYTRGPNWVEGQPVSNQPLRGHLAYLRDLYERSHLVMAGPFHDTPGGLAILQVASPESALALASADPGVVGGILNVAVTAWQPVVWRTLSAESIEFEQGSLTLVASAPSVVGGVPE